MPIITQFTKLKQVHWEKLWSRNVLFLDFIILFAVLGFFVGTAFGMEGKFKDPASGVKSVPARLPEFKSRPATTTTTTLPPTTTTTVPVVKKSEPVVRENRTVQTTVPYKKPPEVITTIPVPLPDTNVVPVEQPVVAQSSQYWLQVLRTCETHGNYQSNTGNGYYGAYQFSYRTWQSMGTGYERADLAPPEVQDDAALRLVARAGSRSQFPGCTSKHGIPNHF